MDQPTSASQPKSLAETYAELAPALVVYARSIGLDHGSAEDVVQRMFLTSLEQGSWPREPRPYFFRAVRNASLNQIRDRSRDVDMSSEEPWFEIEVVDRTAEMDLRRGLNELPRDQREVVMMHVWGGLTFQEAADVLGIPVNTAASRYRYAIVALKKALTVPAEKDGRS